MPISPENKKLYPADWKYIRFKILERANYRCEWPGCGVLNGAIGFWAADSFITHPENKDLTEAAAKYDHPVLKIVLTIAHLDHCPPNCNPTNLRAWCQRHHLRYDAPMKALNRKRNTLKKSGQLELKEKL